MLEFILIQPHKLDRPGASALGSGERTGRIVRYAPRQSRLGSNFGKCSTFVVMTIADRMDLKPERCSGTIVAIRNHLPIVFLARDWIAQGIGVPRTCLCVEPRNSSVGIGGKARFIP